MQNVDGQVLERKCGTPQGEVISPLLVNLFMHYTFDMQITKNLTSVRFCRCADDGVIHCQSLSQAKLVLQKIGARFRECGLELHLDKTKIVYCQDVNRRQSYQDVQFTFFGYTFRLRKVVNKYKRVYVNFSPAVSRNELKAMRQTIRKWYLHLMCNRELSDLSVIFNSILQGWQQYYGRFHGSAMSAI
ncbi:reverse transcriptase domain-containing protein [Acinetobacter sichuanensis]|uniref:Reverse transcriptase n=1 Tax=Acinetobacter sichuanensis TaxID=2136183 RepID=A0A371YKS6_9GAMM|nr:reverse transcriptase domain-containing protein [Acinetobacter sichuanensis]RFC82083.1 reverse transcriptase [Acinetobacter sichuanensis]